MAHKNKSGQPGQETARVPDNVAQGDEFEDAVTTEISGVLARAFDGGQPVDPDAVRVTDAQLTPQLDPATDDALAPGLVLNDRFEIIELVHSGGMSHVYKAVDLRRRPQGSGAIQVAIKMMRPSVASQEEARLSLEREAAKAQILSHPNIISIVDIDDHEGQFFLVMEWLEGESVNALLRRTRGERLAPGFACKVIAGAAAGVQHAHRNNVVHADINPSNLFITDKKDIKLLDFGVARYSSKPEHSDNDRFAWVTQIYASPEVLSGLPPVFEDDVFSLACVAYRLLSGKHPFGGRVSLVAKHQGRSVEPIPGLSDDEWELLGRALSYDRASRPDDVDAFVTWGADSDAIEKSAGRRAGRLSSLLRTSFAAVATVIIVVGSFWFIQRGDDVATTPAVEPVTPEPTVVTDPIDAPVISASQMLLADAAQALEEGRLVAPDESNARMLLREVLAIEQGNAEALRGLRGISNDFVQRAHEALNLDDPLQAYAALAVATETDPGNPAIGIVDQLLVTKGDRELVDAQLASATGDFDLAARQLSRAEQYSHVESAAIQAIRQQIEQGRRIDQLRASLSTADGHISAGRLLSPQDNNAHALLLDLYQQHGDDAQLLASMERLGERLLTRAVVAAAATRVAEATDLLDAVEALDVLAPEVESVRLSLVQTVAEDDTQDVPELQVAEGPLEATPLETIVDAEDVPDLAIAEVQSAAAVETAMTNPDPEPRRQSLQELGITTFVAPEWPRRATRRRVTGGMVEVGFVIDVDGSTSSIQVLQSSPGEIFSKSASEAVRQWRFVTREESTRAQVTLRFDEAR